LVVFAAAQQLGSCFDFRRDGVIDKRTEGLAAAAGYFSAIVQSDTVKKAYPNRWEKALVALVGWGLLHRRY
jgi:hypothetical protein